MSIQLWLLSSCLNTVKSSISYARQKVSMPVKLAAPEKHALIPVKGVQLGVTKAQIRKPDRKDLLVMKLSPGSRVAGVFTQNRFCAAPVLLCKAHLAAD